MEPTYSGIRQNSATSRSAAPYELSSSRPRDSPMQESDYGALFSKCGRYRYLLWRTLRQRDVSAGSIVWLMLNPSTADASSDDPTIRRCLGFTRAWGYRRLLVVNLFAWRTGDPAK